MAKLFYGLLLIVVGLVLYQRTKFTHSKFLYYPAQKTIQQPSSNQLSYYETGVFQHIPNLSVTDKINRKKINNYLFILDNSHKIEIALIDLGYASVLNANYFADHLTYSFEESIRFRLAEDFNEQSDVINREKRKFKFIMSEDKRTDSDGVIQTETNFDILLKRDDGSFQLKLQHIQRSDECVTYIREGVVSYKCYGGHGSGNITISVKQHQSTFNRELSFGRENTTVAFDGFRASGWQWNWVWGMGSGINSLGQHVSINVGTIRQIGEDMIYLDNRIIPIKGFQYLINENFTRGDSIKFTAESPRLEFVFSITAREHKYADLGILKSDMVKFEGYWSGHFEDPQTLNVVLIEHFPGLLETADSIF